MAASVLFDSLNGMRDVSAKTLDHGSVLVWIASTNSWVPRPYNDGSGDPGSMVIGNPVIGGYESHVLFVDDEGKLNQLEVIPQRWVDNLESCLNLKAPKSSPYLTGEPKAAVPNLDDNSLRIATTGWVHGQGYEKAENRGQAFGYPTLDSTGRIPLEQLPTAVVEVTVYHSSEISPALSGAVVGSVPASARGARRSARRPLSSIDPGIIRFSVAVPDQAAPKDSLFKGSDHGGKLCFKDEYGYVHELYS